MMTRKSVELPDFDAYFNDPALVKAYYIPTDPLKLTALERQVSYLLHILMHESE